MVDSKPTIRTQKIVQDHHKRESRVKQIASQPIVLSHSPSPNVNRANVKRTERMVVEPSYETAMANLRFLEKCESQANMSLNLLCQKRDAI